jgi:predicted N-acyltransferase
LDALSLSVLESIADVPAADWDALLTHEPARATPFLEHAWLSALEESGSAAPRAGWKASHLLLRRGGRLVAAAPAYAKDDSEGDFSRDWHWAEAAERAGVPYYPRLIHGIPFTPATGRRVLTAAGEERLPLVRVMIQGARALCAEGGYHSLHVLFPWADEAEELAACGLALRVDFQYHWVNAGYRSMDEFLARFPSKRRNAIKRERSAPEKQGIAIRTVPGSELAADAARWGRAIHDLHRSAVDRMPWGRRFLTRAFYERAVTSMAGNVEVVEARCRGRLVAMAFNVASSERLYGRYWGCVEEHPFLHFNVCLYHSIEDSIRRGLRVFEAGAGGDHKLVRGFEPAETWSAHAFLDARLDRSVRRHLAVELVERRAAVARWREESPVLKSAAPTSG